MKYIKYIDKISESNMEGDWEETIRLKVVSEDHLGVDIVMKRTTRFATLKAGYSNIVKLPISHLKFVFDGRRLGDDDTPETLNMETDDMIEAYMESGYLRIDSHSALYIDSERSLGGLRERDRDEKLLVSFTSDIIQQVYLISMFYRKSLTVFCTIKLLQTSP